MPEVIKAVAPNWVYTLAQAIRDNELFELPEAPTSGFKTRVIMTPAVKRLALGNLAILMALKFVPLNDGKKRYEFQVDGTTLVVAKTADDNGNPMLTLLTPGET